MQNQESPKKVCPEMSCAIYVPEFTKIGNSEIAGSVQTHYAYCIRDGCEAWKRCQQPENCHSCELKPPDGSICIGATGYCQKMYAKVVDF